MKFAVFASLLFVVAGASAFPQIAKGNNDSQNERIIVEGQIKKAIEQLSKDIQEAGLDPLDIDKFEYKHVIVPYFSDVTAVIENLHFSGLSNIVIRDLDYSILFNRLDFDIALPEIALSLDTFEIVGNVIGITYKAGLSGRVAIRGISLAGEVRVNIGVISGISVRSLSLDLNLGGIDSSLNVKVLGEDYSDLVNQFLGEALPNAFYDNRNEINRRLETIVKQILDDIL